MKKALALLGFLVVCLAGCWGPSAQGSASSRPVITNISWGKMTVNFRGKDLNFQDIKIWPRKVREWDWKETGTKHSPGIQPEDLEEFIDKVDVVILTRGMHLVLQVPQETLDYVKSRGKEYYVGQTEDMVKIYNKLVDEGKKVGGVFHSTC